VLAQGAGWGGRDTVGGGTSCGKGIWSTRAILKTVMGCKHVDLQLD
jgi:hypothetical protein